MLAISFTIIIICTISATTSERTFRVTNNCNQKLWFGIQGQPLLYGGGFEVNTRSSIDLKIPDGWVCLLNIYIFCFIISMCKLKLNR